MKINVVFCSIIFLTNVVGVAPCILTDQNAQNPVDESSTQYENNIQSYSHFKNAYFDNLTVNFGKNLRGSCGIVALGQLLSYYDTFYNDNIIDEIYDVNCNYNSSNMIQARNSPGISGIDSEFSDEYLQSITYIEYLDKINDENSFHGYLLNKGMQLNIFDNLNTFKNEFGTSQEDRIALLELYFEEKNISNYTIYSNSQNHFTVRDFVIEQISLKRPVLLGMSHNGVNGHAAIAYDYNEVTDTIYCNMGWNRGTTRVSPESDGFNRFDEAMSIDFTGLHSHSNNYILNNNGTLTYHCYDDEAIITTHASHNFSYVSYNSSKHYKKCSCGINYLSIHNFELNQVNPGLFYIPLYVCTKCGYQTRVLPVGEWL